MLAQQTLELLRQQTPFIAVRVWQSNSVDVPLGTLMLITADQVFGYFPQNEQEIIKQARQYLLEGKNSESKIYHWDKTQIKVCFDFLGKRPILVIVGAGHIAIPLNKIAKMLAFKTIIIDPRPECNNTQRFPDADEIILEGYPEGLKKITLDDNSYVALLTPGHVHDRACLNIVLDKPVAYLGMICSLRRKAAVFSLLQELGRKLDELKQIFAPIGLPIATETPEEIAVSIISEILAIRNCGKSWVLQVKKGESTHGKSELLW